MSTLARGGQIGSIAWKDKERVKLYEWFCLNHQHRLDEKPNLVKMKQNVVEQKVKGGIRFEYFSTCLQCWQVVKEGEYVRDE